MSDRHPVFELSDQFVDRLAELRPTLATVLGIPGHDAEWDDTSPAGVARIEAFLREQRTALDALAPAEDRWAQLAVRVLGEYIQLALDPIEHHDHERDLGHLQGTFPGLRESFDQMENRTDQCGRNIATRLGTIGEPLAGLRACLTDGMAAGRWAAQRQAPRTNHQARPPVRP